MRKIKLGSKKAISLIEVLVSVAIFSIIIVPVGHMVTTVIRINKEGEYKQKAVTMAQQIIEELKSYSSVTVADTVEIRNGTLVLRRMALDPAGGYDIGYEADNYAVESDYKAHVTFMRKKSISYEQRVKPRTESYDLIIQIWNTYCTLTDHNSLQVNYSGFQNNIKLINNDISGTGYIKFIDYNTDGTERGVYTFTRRTGSSGGVKLIYNSAVSLPVSNIRVENQLASPFSIYTVKQGGTSVNTSISNEAGEVRVYDNLSDALPTSTNDGVYEIFVEIFKGSKKVYETSTTKNVVN